MEKIKSSELLQQVLTSTKNDFDFCDIVDLDSAYNRHLHLGEIDNPIADSFNSYISFFNRLDEQEGIPVEEREPIKIFIDSGGGDLMGTLTIIDAIRNSKTPVWTINIGQAYSGGFFIFIAGHRRLSYKNATFLFHEGSTGSHGDAHKFNNWADFYKKMLKRLKSIVLEYTEISEEEYDQHAKDDWWLLADEAIEYKVCDEIINEMV
jgi:ATP-dependent Clp protease protease subunit